MSREALLSLIRRVPEELPGVRFIVLSGGEVTLLKQDLVEAIRLISDLGLGSRIVTNGGWASTEEEAARWASDLRQAGLGELNLSTGDDHIEWIPLERVTRAAEHSVRAGMLTVITIEGQKGATHTLENLHKDHRVRRVLADLSCADRLILMTNLWMPFHKDTDIRASDNFSSGEGCDNIFHNYVVNPYGNILSCCGLTMEYIPEMTISHVNSCDDLAAPYHSQFNDLLKLWIWLDGTKKIIDSLRPQLNTAVRIESPHPCAICAQIYQDSALRSAAIRAAAARQDELLFRAAMKANLLQPAAAVSL